jgi:hypothetical protein
VDGGDNHHVMFDVRLSTMADHDYFPNIWQLQALGADNNKTCQPSNIVTTSAEEGLFHFPPFANATCPTFSEASDRIIYGAWNVCVPHAPCHHGT